MMKKLWFNIIPIVLTIIGFFYLIRSCAHASERPYGAFSAPESVYQSKESYWDWVTYREIDENSKKREWQEAYELHQFHAVRTFNNAKDKCWYLPRTTDREKARYCFTSVMSSLGAATKKGKLVNSLVTLLINYGLDAMDEWDYIREQLNWSEYHYEQCEFYQNLLARG